MTNRNIVFVQFCCQHSNRAATLAPNILMLYMLYELQSRTLYLALSVQGLKWYHISTEPRSSERKMTGGGMLQTQWTPLLVIVDDRAVTGLLLLLLLVVSLLLLLLVL